MTLAMELKRQENIGRKEEREKMIYKLSNKHMSIEFIAEVTESSPEFIEKVLSQKSAMASE